MEVITEFSDIESCLARGVTVELGRWIEVSLLIREVSPLIRSSIGRRCFVVFDSENARQRRKDAVFSFLRRKSGGRRGLLLAQPSPLNYAWRLKCHR